MCGIFLITFFTLIFFSLSLSLSLSSSPSLSICFQIALNSIGHCYIRMIYNEVNFMQFMLDLILVFCLSCIALTHNIKFLDNDFLYLIYQETINLK